MFDVGFWEVSLIFVVALLVVGPEKLPGLARTVGLYVGKARRYADHVRREIENDVRAAELKEMVDESKTIADVKQTLNQSGDALRSQIASANAAVTAETSSAITETPASSSGETTPDAKDA